MFSIDRPANLPRKVFMSFPTYRIDVPIKGGSYNFSRQLKLVVNESCVGNANDELGHKSNASDELE